VRCDDLPEYLTADDLDALGVTVEDVRRLDPQPVEYTSLDGRPCWRRDELVDALELFREADPP
jgi:hypothetical protein